VDAVDTQIVLRNESKVDRVVSAIQGQLSGNALRPGDRLMTVRNLSSLYNINERTVMSALNVLNTCGMIEKKGKSYFISSSGKNNDMASGGNSSEEFETFHPFISHESMGMGTRTVKMAVYENMPHQQKCWNEIARKFSETHHGIKMEINWVPNSVNSSDSYLDFLRDAKMDLALLPERIAIDFHGKNILSPLPTFIRDRISDEAYLSSNIERADKELSDYAAPIHFSMQALIFNHDTFRGDIGKTFNGIDSVVKEILKISNASKNGSLLMHVPWELAILEGMPEYPVEVKELKEHLGKLYRGFSRLKGLKDRLNWEKIARHFKDYASGNVMFYAGALTLLLPLIEQSKFRWTGAFHKLHGNKRMSCGISSVAAMKTPAGPIEDALDFLTSEAAQSIISKYRLNFTCYLETNRPLIEKMGANEKDFLANLKRLSEDQTETGKWHVIIVQELMSITRAVIDGEMSPETAVEKAVKYIEETYPGRIV
jgi:DNA-binding transcriptional regulator YhcF (GntR family)